MDNPTNKEVREVPMKYRFATVRDAHLIAPMNHQLIRDEGHRNAMSRAELEERMTEWLEGEYQAVLFEDSQGTAGYALFKWEPEWVYLRQFFVQPNRRHTGIGKAAIIWLLANAWGDAYRIRLDVLAGNAAGIAFWRSLGFADYCLTMEKPVVQNHNHSPA
jgi:GNAT superfamily N-acetyltransferase